MDAILEFKAVLALPVVVPFRRSEHIERNAFSMSTDQERFLKTVIQALQDRSVGTGDLAWVLVGVLLVVGIATMLLILRWIRGGGFSGQTAFGFFGRR